jgi:uncharacterized membrane protein YccC
LTGRHFCKAGKCVYAPRFDRSGKARTRTRIERRTLAFDDWHDMNKRTADQRRKSQRPTGFPSRAFSRFFYPSRNRAGDIVRFWLWVKACVAKRGVELRLCIRVTIAALLTFALSELLHVPQVLWTVLTAVVVSQLSLGKSVKATIDYFIGTLGGAVYSGCVAVLLPHSDDVGLLIVLAVTIAPLALLAAIKPPFGAAPITAVMVLLAPTITFVDPLHSAFYRVIEVALGGTTALLVSFLILPSHARGQGIEAAARMLHLMARALRELLAHCTQELDAASIGQLQRRIGEDFARLEIIGNEARRERIKFIGSELDLGPFLRTLLRLRHDLIMIGRAASPLPDVIRARLAPPLERVSESVAEYLEKTGDALSTRIVPSLSSVEMALDAYEAEIANIRRDGLTRSLPSEALERVFALGFALEQLHQDFMDVERWIEEFARDDSA